MKKILLILCALVCGTLAFAQTARTYTDWLHVVAGNDDAGVQQADVAVEWTDESNRVIDFVLKDFSITISMSNTPTLIPLGDVTMLGVNVGETENGVATISCTDDHEVTFTDPSYASLVTDITVNMTGDISEDKLHADMEIYVTIVLLGNYTVTATFGYDYGEYLIVHADNGNYFGGGLDYGTHATETDKPQFFTFIQQADGTYLLNGHQAKSTSLGLDEAKTDYYIDAVNPHSWELIEAGDGSGYYIADEIGYLKGNGIYVAATTVDQKDDATVWKFVTMDDVLATMDGASISNPVDVTPLIPAPEPKYNSYKNSWTATGYNETAVPNNYCFGGDAGWNATTPLCESYHSNNGFDVRQTISSLPAGYYELTAQAFYRNDGGTVIPSMYITTGTCATDGGYIEKVHLPEHYTESDNMNGAYQEFLQGLYPVTLPFVVDAEGEEFTVGFESNVEDNDLMWSIFGELSLTYLGTELPTLTVVEGTMNVNVEATMIAAVATYNSNKTLENFIAAEQALEDAEESIAYYEEIAPAIESKEYEAVLATFDEAGQAAFQTDFLDAYAALTLTNQTVEDGLAAACKKQTTEFCDMSYALKNSGTWTNAIGATNFQLCPTLPTAHEIWSENAWTVTGRDVTENKAIYKQVDGLPAGIYTLSFYAYGDAAEEPTHGRPLAYANDADEQEVAYLAELGEAWTSASLYTFICEVGEDGILEFGMNTQGDGNWYVMEEYSLIYGEVEQEPEPEDVPSDYQPGESLVVDGVRYTIESENSIPNHSFELGFEGWTKASDFTTTIDEDFELRTDDPENGDYYLVGTSTSSNGSTAGSAGTSSLGTAWPIEAGKTYLFTYWLKQVDMSQDAELEYLVTSLTNTPGTETVELAEPTISEEWAPVQYVFTNGEEGAADCYDYVQVKFRWLKGRYGFDNFSLHEVTVDPYTDDVTYLLSNPSFEDDDVSEWTPDTNEGGDSRCNADGEGAWIIPTSSDGSLELTGWSLKRMGDEEVFDLMTKDAAATDNGLGAPGEASDGDYMLYIKKTWGEEDDQVSYVEQTATLPAGEYKLTVDSKFFSNAATAKLIAGSESASIVVNGTDATNGILTGTAWTTNELTFTVVTDDEEGAEVTIGVEMTFANSGLGSLLLDNFKLFYTEEIEQEPDPYIYDITDRMTNPSFEDVDVTELTIDTTRGTEEGGAWTITADEMNGWDLVSPTHTQSSEWGVSDIMSAAATATDNDFGAPGTPSDETYMLYLRESHASREGGSSSSSVEQSVVLPAGEYKVTVDSKCIADNEEAGTVTLVAGEASQAISFVLNAVPEDWTTTSLEFTLDATTEVTLGVDIAYTGDHALSVLLDNFTLWSTEPVDDYVYDVTKVLANPSFEDVDVADLTVDTTRGPEEGGAWTITADEMNGWDLVSPTHTQSSEWGVSDIMSAAATATDNDFGAPGTPSDETYMLYLRESHASREGGSSSSSVEQSVVLPAGEYKVTVDSKCIADNEEAGTVTLVAGEASQAIDFVLNAVPEDWTTTLVTFSLTEATEVTLGVDIAYTGDHALSVLLDNFKLWSTADIPETTIEWELADVGWGTMIIPFDAELPEGMVAYAGDAITINDTELELGDEATSIEANVPYLVTGEVGTYTFTGIPTNTADSYNVGVLVGTLVDMAYDDENNDFTPNSGQYVLQNHAEGGLAFYQITENSKGVKLAAYHCYLTTTAGISALSLPGMATGIEAVESDLIANDAIYDLSGRKVSKAVKGVYIINGKKVLVK